MKKNSFIFTAVEAFITVSYYGSLVGLVLFIVMLVLSRDWEPAIIGIPVNWSDTTVYTEVKQVLESGKPYHLVEKGDGQLYLTVPAVINMFFFDSKIPVSILFYLGILRLVQKIFRSISLNTPFHPSNPKRLAGIGWLIIALYVYNYLERHLLDWYIDSHFIFSVGNLEPVVQQEGNILYGVLLLVIGQVYKRGVELAQETELTV